jgi:hypothetical protein
MQRNVLFRLRALERLLPEGDKPRKPPLPEWLVSDLQQQNVRFDASGRSDLTSCRREATAETERCNATTAD